MKRSDHPQGTDNVIVRHVYPYQNQLYIASNNGLSSLPLQALTDTTQLVASPVLSDLMVLKMLLRRH